MKPIVKIITTGVIVLAALGMIAYKYHDYMKYPWTRDGLVRAQVVQIVPRVSGALVRVPIQNNQLVKKGDLLFEIDPSTFQATVNLARAQLDNMRDIVKFRETFVGNFQKGDRAVVTLMSYPDTPLEGSVDSIGWGIAQQNGSTGFEQLPSVQPTFEWIRLAQRIPVMVRIEKAPGNIKLRAGTTASVVVITGTSTDGDRVPPVPLVLQ